MCYPSSENKGADQLCSYCTDDLCLCFRLSRLLVFPWGGSVLWRYEYCSSFSQLSFSLSKSFKTCLHQGYYPAWFWNEPRREKTGLQGFRAGPTQTGLYILRKKFRIKVEEELCYPSSENNGADQLCSYCTDDLCLCFRLCRLLVFPWGGSVLWRYEYCSSFSQLSFSLSKSFKTCLHQGYVISRMVLKWAATWENRSAGFPSRSDTNQPVHSQEIARSLKFRIKEDEELRYPSSENKGADQLCSYCFRTGKNPVLIQSGLVLNNSVRWT